MWCIRIPETGEITSNIEFRKFRLVIKLRLVDFQANSLVFSFFSNVLNQMCNKTQHQQILVSFLKVNIVHLIFAVLGY